MRDPFLHLVTPLRTGVLRLVWREGLSRRKGGWGPPAWEPIRDARRGASTSCLSLAAKRHAAPSAHCGPPAPSLPQRRPLHEHGRRIRLPGGFLPAGYIVEALLGVPLRALWAPSTPPGSLAIASELHERMRAPGPRGSPSGRQGRRGSRAGVRRVRAPGPRRRRASGAGEGADRREEKVGRGHAEGPTLDDLLGPGCELPPRHPGLPSSTPVVKSICHSCLQAGHLL